MTVTMAETNMNPPKKSLGSGASKKNKKSWRKNTDIADIEEFLDEKRFDERVGGSFEDRPDSALFVVDKSKGEKKKKNSRKDPKPLKCFANLLGLPGAKDPIKKRNRTKLPDERVNPIVKDMQDRAIKAGKVKRKRREATKARIEAAKRKEETILERTTRRRTNFDFNLWGDEEKEDEDDWMATDTKVHTAKNSGKLVPRATKARASDTTGTLCPAVEIPHAGQSYNPSLGDHQDLLWKAAIVEMDKEKELTRIERGTTMMFPGAGYKQEETYIQEMSEGIKELEKEGEAVEEESEEEENDEEKEEGVKCKKLIGRKRKRDRRGRKFEENKKRREMESKKEQQEVMRLKSIKKELKVDDEMTKDRQEKREEADKEKRKGAIQLSNYKFENQELEIKLSDELTGNLRNLKAEGSLLEDRFKSLQKRNVIETRVPQKIVKKAHKRKKFEKKSYKMGWEPKGYTPFTPKV